MAQQILIIDDEPEIGEFVRAAAESLGWQCSATTNVADFLEALTPDTTLIFLDLIMPETDGVELLRLLGKRNCTAGIVLMSGLGKRVMETADELAGTLGLFVAGHLRKPFQVSDIRDLLVLPNRPGPTPASVLKKKSRIPRLDVRNAIKHDQFVMHFQPQIQIETGRVVGFEALVRWNHPLRGLIFPDDFISQVEALGCIDQLGWLVAKHAFASIGQFADQDGEAPVISINVAAHSLLDLKFPETLLESARMFGIPPGNVRIEITESGILKELSKTLDVLTRLRMRGVEISIDDFGTGYSMMQQLRRIPATELKIDRSFVRNMHVNDGDRVIVQKTIELGHELGMTVVVEGIETAAQLDFMRLNGCDVAQGYFFTRPLASAAMLGWLKEHRSSSTHTTPQA